MFSTPVPPPMTPRLKRLLLWSLGIGVGVLGVLVAGTTYLLRPERFAVSVGLLSAFRKHANTVLVDGLKISVPPSDARRELAAPRPPTARTRCRT